MNLYLIGYRCTGKTSVGKRIAGELRFDFLDADAAFVRETGKTVAAFVDGRGWEGFRDLEETILQDIAGKNGWVVATGGGVVLRPDNISRMQDSGLILWLQASVETIYDRMQKDTATADLRPGLTEKPLLEEIQETLAMREPLYAAAADFSLATDGLPMEAVCDRVLEILRS